jgi:hypothetical protein
MSNQERKLDELKKAVPTEKGEAFDVEIPDKDLESASGGLNESDIAPAGDLCMCKCGTAATCGGGGGG